MMLYRIPDYRIVDVVVAVNDAIAHPYDFTHAWIDVPVFWIDAVKLVECFPHDLKLPFHCGTKE